MRPPEKGRAPRQAPSGMHISSGSSGLDSTLQQAALLALDHELAIIVAALNDMAAGKQLSWDDQDRLHEAHQFFIRILADLRGVEVLS